MSLFTRFSAYRFLVFGSLALVVLSSPLRAQDLRKWMPNVGDRFYYRQDIQASTWENGHPIGGNNYTTKATEIILSDTIIDSTHSVVTAQMGAEISERFQLTDSSNTGAMLPLIIFGPNGLMDFTRSQAVQTNFDGQAITCFVANNGSNMNPVYSPDLKWFTFRWIEFGDLSNGKFGMSGTDTSIDCYLTAVDEARVTEGHSASNNTIDILGLKDGLLSLSLSANGSSIEISFLDLLGRRIHSWQMPVEAGEREITLNVADVPSGVYFLHVSGEGIDEVKKVCISL